MTHSPIQDYLNQMHARISTLQEGQVANYIPELSNANPDWFGICVATRDGYLYEVGDTQQLFTLQSISKAIIYGLALEDHGEDFVLTKIGVEASGEAFNAISLRHQTGLPFNPMINIGAIAACGLIKGGGMEDKIGRILAVFSRYAGRTLDVDMQVYRSESETGHRNRAIGWMLRNCAILGEEPTPTLETYFQQCSIRVHCRDLAIIGATLANGGINPLTGERAIQEKLVPRVLSVMASCGMYDFSGEWLYRVGLPAKSGVGGGMMAVLPGQLGIGVFSPPLDAQGNSVRGIAVCQQLSKGLDLHLLNIPTPPAWGIRLSYDGSTVSSKRRRSLEEAECLRSACRRVQIYQMQGSLSFTMVEGLIRDIFARLQNRDYFIVNLKAVATLDKVSVRLLTQTAEELARLGKCLIFSHAVTWRKLFASIEGDDILFFQDNDFALEYCENRMLAEALPWAGSKDAIALGECALFSGLENTELQALEKFLTTHTNRAGERVIRQGDPAEELFILLSGSVTASIPSPTGRTRLDVFTAGMTFGEVALLDHFPRSADVIANEDIVYRKLSRANFLCLDNEMPLVKIKLLHNLATGLTTVLRHTNLAFSVHE